MPTDCYSLAFFILTQMAKEIILTQGKVAIVDDEDFDYLNQFKWYAHKMNNNFYTQRSNRINKKYAGTLYIHRIIMNASKGSVVDHINGNTLDNRKCNLRICTHGQNIRNQKININNTSGFKGVCYRKDKNKWRVVLQLNSKKIHIGYYLNIIDAAKAYNEAAIKYHGEFANLNKIN